MGKYRPYECAWITGGSGGIGMAVAEELLREGTDVLLIARDRAALKRAEEHLHAHRTRPEQRIGTLSVDVSDAGAVEREFAEARERFGEPDLLINGAGFAYPHYFERIPADVFRRTLDINVVGVWNSTRAVVDALKARRGAVVIVSSLAGLVGTFGYTAYSASKFALIGFSEALRGELAPYGARVHVLCPPDTDTRQLREEELTKPEETKALAGKAKVLPPRTVARALMRGMRRGSFLIVPGFDARMIVLLNRFAPALVRRVVDLQIRNAARNKITY